MRHKLNILYLFILALAVVGFGNSTFAADKPLKVFILSGQSNMEGKAQVSTLEAAINNPKTNAEFKHLKNGDQWAVRNDVWVTYLDRKNRGKAVPKHGALTVGFGGYKQARNAQKKRVEVATIGPELGIGHVLGDHFDEPVLLIKAAWGGRALKYSFRPPSAMPSDEEIKTEIDEIKKRKPDLDVSFESRKEGYGSDYRKILSETQRVLKNIKTYVPNYEGQGYQIAGFIWFQGWNDGVGKGNPEYVEQMTHFIKDLRRDLKVPQLPVVVGELGVDGEKPMGWISKFRKQQEEIASKAEFKGTVALAKTAPYWSLGVPDMSQKWKAFRKLAQANSKKSKDDPSRIDPGKFYTKNWQLKFKDQLALTSDKRYHYLGSGACFYRMGASMGRTMVKLLKSK